MNEDPRHQARLEFQQAAIRHGAGDARGAIAGYRRAIALDPGYAEAYCNMGVDLYDLGGIEPALAAYQVALALRPDFLEAHNNLGNALLRQGRAEEAAACFRRAIALNPTLSQPHTNLGQAQVALGQIEQAEATHRHAVSLAPADADAVNDLANALALQNRCEEALALYAEVIRLAPDYPRPRVNYALTLLKLGRMAEGWAAYEWRWKNRPHAERAQFWQPEWDGGPLAGRTLLLYAEQGYGDSLQFIRFLFTIPTDGTVILRVPPPLVRLFHGLGVTVIGEDVALPVFDCHLSMMSLARLSGATLETLPAQVPYLTPAPALAAAWAERLAVLPGKKVGLVWSGNPRPQDEEANRLDRRRSLPPELLSVLADIPNLSLISLQKDPVAAPPALHLTNWMAEISDFADSAALVAGLDLVITVDTAIAHLAGALAKPVWIVSRFDGCWRWLLNRDDTPWYPTARLFRQNRYGDWSAPLARLAVELQAFCRE